MVLPLTIQFVTIYGNFDPSSDAYIMPLTSLWIPHISANGKVYFTDPNPELYGPAPKLHALTRMWQLIDRKLDYWSRALQATYLDIAYTEGTLLYDRSSAVIQRQLAKATALQSIVDQLSDLPFTALTEGALEKVYLAERGFYQYTDAFTLYHEFAHYYFEGTDAVDAEFKKREIRIRRHQLMVGRIQSRYFKPIFRDIRRLFRSLVRNLFIHINDQSEEDEFLVRGATP